MTDGPESAGAGRRSWRLLGALVVVAAAVAGGWGLLVSDAPDPLERAALVVEDHDRWTTGSDAAEALGAVADALVDEADGCDPAGRRCAHLHAAIGWSQVSALTALRCSQPFIVDVRANAGDLVRRLRSGGPDVEPPPVVTC